MSFDHFETTQALRKKASRVRSKKFNQQRPVSRTPMAKGGSRSPWTHELCPHMQESRRCCMWVMRCTVAAMIGLCAVSTCALGIGSGSVLSDQQQLYLLFYFVTDDYQQFSIVFVTVPPSLSRNRYREHVDCVQALHICLGMLLSVSMDGTLRCIGAGSGEPIWASDCCTDAQWRQEATSRGLAAAPPRSCLPLAAVSASTISVT